MSRYVIGPGRLEGSVTPPLSKSQLHRLLIAHSLAGDKLSMPRQEMSRDVMATDRCLAALQEKNGPELPLLDCGESGSTLRFLLPLALVRRGGGIFLCRGRLSERPLQPYFDLFREQNVRWSREGERLTAEGSLTAGTYRLAGNVSSQFVTGLLFALPLLEGESRIELTTPLESRPYVDMTLEVLRATGIVITEQENTFTINGNQSYQPFELAPEADWSQGAFWYAANFLDHRITIEGLRPDSVQGDRQIALWYWTLARPGAVTLDMSQQPDLLPAAALMACARMGKTEFVHAGRLRDKECDRLSAVTEVLTALGARIRENPEGLTVQGPTQWRGGVTLDVCGDHRIAMMAAIAAAGCPEPVTIPGGDCVKKSYPEFWEDYEKLGGSVRVSGE